MNRGSSGKVTVRETAKVLFLHVPKTGGQSVYAFLKSNYVGKIQYIHTNLTQQLEHTTSKELQKIFIFCFVRNPWDRLVSNYFYAIEMYNIFKNNPTRMKSKLNQFRKNVASMSFHDFVLSLSPRILQQNLHLRPQTTFMSPLKNFINYTGKFENLEEDMRHLSNLLHISYTPLPLVNVSERERRYTDYYTEKTKDIVSKLYYQDIIEFDYIFGEENESK